jgi:hypothetical protein
LPVPLRARSLAELLDLALELVRHTFVQLTPLMAAALLMGFTRDAIIVRPTSVQTLEVYAPTWVLATLFKALLLGTCTIMIAGAYAGRAETLPRAILAAAKRVLAFYALSLGLYVAVVIGILLLVAPGLAVLQRYGLAPTVLLLEQRPLVDALRRSDLLSRHSHRRLLESYIVVYGLYGLALLAALFLVPKVLGAGLASRTVRVLIGTLAFPILASFRTALYFDTRIRSEGLDLEGRLSGLEPGA